MERVGPVKPQGAINHEMPAAGGREINLPPGDAKPRLKTAQPKIQTVAEWMAKGILIEFSRQFDSAANLLIAEPGQS